METVQTTTEVSSGSQRIDNSVKHPDVLKLFSDLLSSSEPTKLDRQKGKSELLESFQQSEFKLDPNIPNNQSTSILAYISYWVAVFLFERSEMRISRKEFYQKLVQMVKPVADDVKKILNKKISTNWIEFSKHLPSIKYSANALKQEYLSFFGDIRNMINKNVKIKVGNRKPGKRQEQLKASTEFEITLNTELINENLKVKQLIDYWVKKYVELQFGPGIDEFVDNFMLLIPYTYLIYMKTVSLPKPITDWNWDQFIEEVEKMDLMDPNQLLDAASSGIDHYVPTNGPFFTSTMLARPDIFVRKYVDAMVKLPARLDGRGHVVIRIKSDQSVRISYGKIFHSSFSGIVNDDHHYVNPKFGYVEDEKKGQTIYKFISRWTERRNNSKFLGPFLFIVGLLTKLSSIKAEESECWNQQMESNVRLREYYSLFEGDSADSRFTYYTANAKDTFANFVDEWIGKLKPNFVADTEDIEDFTEFLNACKIAGEKFVV